MRDFANLLREGLAETGRTGYKIPTMQLGSCMLKFLACFSADIRDTIPFLGISPVMNNQASRDILGIEYKRSVKELITESAVSFIKMGMIEDKKPS